MTAIARGHFGQETALQKSLWVWNGYGAWRTEIDRAAETHVRVRSWRERLPGWLRGH
jgi:hypothetical protein